MAFGEPPPGPGAEGSAKKDLSSWWKSFKKNSQKKDDGRGRSFQTSASTRSLRTMLSAAVVVNASNVKLVTEIVDVQAPQGIFGVPLQTSVRYANVAISLTDPAGQSYIYGYVPIIVAKCGVFLKEKGTLQLAVTRAFANQIPATDVEGIFRLSGSEKRIKELRIAFDSPDRYGKGLDWTGYTVHDAANILRRYFNHLPEPIIPLEFYDRFRNPLKHHQSQAVGVMDGQSPSVGDFDMDTTIKLFQQLITELPPLNRQLLLYILDLLAVFASKSDLNKMTTPNLAAIFQPGILSHPTHDMAPQEYRLSQDVLIFLIENQDHFLIGMPGTAADTATVQEVESGPPTPQNRSATPRHSKSTVVRTGSNSSRYSGVRRSVSVSSKRSKNSVAASPVGTEFHTPLGSPVVSGVVQRSNTLPPSRSPNLAHPRFGRENHSGKSTPDAPISEEPPVQAKTGDKKATPVVKMHTQGIMHEMMTPTDDEPNMSFPVSTPLQQSSNEHTADGPRIGINRPQAEGLAVSTRALSPPPGQETPTSASKAFVGMFKSPPLTDSRKPNKLQKKPKSSSRNPSAQSSTNDLNGASAVMVSDENAQSYFPTANIATAPVDIPQRETKTVLAQSDGSPLESPPPIGGLHPGMSPSASYRSYSDMEQLDNPDSFALQGDAAEGSAGDAEKRRKKWFSRKNESSATQTDRSFGTNDPAGRSRSSILSGGDARKSATLERSKLSSEGGFASTAVTSDSEREGKKNPINWIKSKLQERAEKRDERDRVRDEKRLTSPARGEQSASVNSLTAGVSQSAASQPQPPAEKATSQQSRIGRSMDVMRGKSMDVPRSQATHPSPHRQSQDAPQSLLSASQRLSNPAAAQGQVAAPVPISE
jgi:GTPase-activating protein SAC7